MHQLFAKRKSDGKFIDASDVPRGLACECFCSDCGVDLIARHCSSKVDHFAHHKKQRCEASKESHVHKAAKAAIEELGYIWVPPLRLKSNSVDFDRSQPARKFVFSKIEIERKLRRFEGKIAPADKQPDAILYNEKGSPLAVEFKYKHPVSYEKMHWYNVREIASIEVDLSHFAEDVPYREIKSAISKGELGSYWIYNRFQWIFKDEEERLISKWFGELEKRKSDLRDKLRSFAKKIPITIRRGRFGAELQHIDGCPRGAKSYRGGDFADLATCKSCFAFYGTLYDPAERRTTGIRCGAFGIKEAEFVYGEDELPITTKELREL